MHAPGVRKILLTSNGRPAPVPTAEVARHMADDARLCDLTNAAMPAFQPGVIVSIEAGALSGHTGIVSECNGMVTTIEVELFARPMLVRLSRADAALAA